MTTRLNHKFELRRENINKSIVKGADEIIYEDLRTSMTVEKHVRMEPELNRSDKQEPTERPKCGSTPARLMVKE